MGQDPEESKGLEKRITMPHGTLKNKIQCKKFPREFPSSGSEIGTAFARQLWGQSPLLPHAITTAKTSIMGVPVHIETFSRESSKL